jgi:AraC family transcriptional regulator, arabinose operon regulatory protein
MDRERGHGSSAGESGQPASGRGDLVLTNRQMESAFRRWPWLKGLYVCAAGYFPKAAGPLECRSIGAGTVAFFYCVKGGGWIRVHDRVHPVRRGDLFVGTEPPALVGAADGANPWTLHWLQMRGTRLADYLRELKISDDKPVLRVGEDLMLITLFNEVRRHLGAPDPVAGFFHATHTLAHLLSVLVQRQEGGIAPISPMVAKTAQAIAHMTERLDAPLRVGELAALVNLSPAHFRALFREQTGCSPLHYLNLLRMHHACQWLTGTPLSVKEIASRLGYRDPFHFSRRFKAFTGVAPTRYRARGQPPSPGGFGAITADPTHR